MAIRHEIDRLKNVIRRREERQGNMLFATVIDASPQASHGYVIARLVDGTAIHVRSWTPIALMNGQQIIVAPMGGQTWNWYVLIQVNASQDVEATPYQTPSIVSSAVGVHPLDSTLHTGQLPWGRIDTSIAKVDLGSQVTGILPTGKQAKQTTVSVVTIHTGSIMAGDTAMGSVAGPVLALVRKVEVSGPGPFRLRFREAAGGTVEYETAIVAPPFLDQGGWIHLESARSPQLHWEAMNAHTAAGSFTITLQLISWEV